MNTSDKHSRPSHQKVAKILDELFTIPGTKVKVGLDPLIGLIPGAGDIIGGLLGLYFIWEGSRKKLPLVILIRMSFNIILEVIIGSIPFLGDLFDVSWKANQRNADLIDEYSDHQNKTTFLSSVIVWAVFLVTAAIVIGLIATLIMIFELFWDRLFQY